MKKLTLFIIIILYTLFLTGCDPFDYPTGEWVCEELDITANFDSNESTIIIDEVVEEIVIIIYPGGGVDIIYSSDIEKSIGEREYLYRGSFKHKNGRMGGAKDGKKGEIIFTTSEKIDYIYIEKEYTFIRNGGAEFDTRTSSQKISQWIFITIVELLIKALESGAIWIVILSPPVIMIISLFVIVKMPKVDKPPRKNP